MGSRSTSRRKKSSDGHGLDRRAPQLHARSSGRISVLEDGKVSGSVSRTRGRISQLQEVQPADEEQPTTITMGTLADGGTTITNTAMTDQASAPIATGIS